MSLDLKLLKLKKIRFENSKEYQLNVRSYCLFRINLLNHQSMEDLNKIITMISKYFFCIFHASLLLKITLQLLNFLNKSFKSTIKNKKFNLKYWPKFLKC